MSDLPSGWAVAILDDLVNSAAAITDGPFGSNLKTSHYTQSGPRVVRLQNIGDGIFIDEEAHISHEHFSTLKKHEVEAGDVLVASLGEQLPRACLAPPSLGPAIVKADCIRIRPAPEVLPAYLMFVLNSPQVRSATSTRIKGVGRPRINLSELRTTQVPVAPLAEQRRIVETIEAAFSKLDAGVAYLGRVIQLQNSLAGRASALRRSILATAFSGQLVLQDRSDEPAEVLLERIAAARAVFDDAAAQSRRRRRSPSPGVAT